MIKKNIQEIENYLKGITQRVTNMKPIMHTIGEKVVSKSMESFEKERDPITGQAWSPVSSNTTFAQIGGKKRSNTKRGKQKLSDKRVLQDQGIRGGLMGSIDFTATKNSTEITAGKEYAATHFFGDKKRNIAQRRFLPFDDDLDLDKKLANEIIEDIEDYILGDS